MSRYCIPLPEIDEEHNNRLALHTALASLSSLFGDKLTTQEAILVSSNEMAIDGLMLALGALPVTGDPIPAPETPVVKPKRASKRSQAAPAATMVCSQCGSDRQPTKSGVCKPCAMTNARTAKNKAAGKPVGGMKPVEISTSPKAAALPSGKTDSRFSEPQIFADDRSADAGFLRRNGAIRGKKLG